jgi:P4 family phage/plasmid primase-like protien
MSFTRYLKENFTKNTDTFQTHVSFINGKYNIPNESLDNFYKEYFETIKTNEKLYLMEKITNSNFAYFLDIEVPKNSILPKLTNNDIQNVLDKNNLILKKYIQDVDVDTSYIVTKRNDKYHVNYYNIILNNESASIIAYILANELKELGDIIDRSVYNTNLRMLGSYKKENVNDHGDLTYRIYNLKIERYTEYCDMTLQQFIQTTIRRPNTNKINTLQNVPEEIKNKIKIGKNKQVVKIDKVIEIEIVKYLQELKRTNDLFDKYNVQNIMSIKTVLNKFNNSYLHYISIGETYCPFKDRCHSRPNSPIYIEIGFKGTFIKCYDSDCKGKRYPENGIQNDINEIDYPNLYMSLNKNYLPTELKIDSKLREILENSLSGTHYQVAKVVFTIYKNKFRVDGLKNTDWYEFDGIRFNKSYFFNILLSSEIPRYYKALLIGENKESEESEETITMSQLVKKIVLNLENAVFKRNIMDQCIMLFKNHDPYFMEKLDANPYLLGFKNGIYDLKKGLFRPGQIDDYITFNTGYDYTEYDPECDQVKDIFKFFQQIIPNKIVLEFLLCILAKSIIGIVDEKFYILTGNGSNGKSTLINLIEYALGDFFVSSDSSLLTNKKGLSSSASPDITRLKGRRVISFSEPENVSLHTSTIKQFSGDDTIIARELYKAPISFKLQGTMFLSCNDIPKVDNLDGGILRRLRIIEFKSKFCQNPTPDNIYEHKIDPKLSSKLQNWKPYFIGILIHYLQFKDTIKEPEEVKVATSNYFEDNDNFNEFFKECIVKDKNTFTPLKEIYNEFVMWFVENYKNEKTPSLSKFKSKIRLENGNEITVKGKKGYHLRLVSPDDNEDIFER